MKKDSFLINSARGGIINEGDLKTALSGGLIAGAAIDAYMEEPPVDIELLNLPNLICTPHIGGNSKEAVEAMGMSGKERAFVITLVIMLCMVVSFIIIRVNNKPEEIWVEIPPAEEIAKLLEEEKLPQDSQEENSVTDNTPVTTRSYNEADSRIKQAEDLKSLDDLLAEQQGQETNSQGENAPEEGEGTTPAKIEPYKVNDGMSFKDLEKYKPQNKDEKKANKRTLISYYLVGREAVAELPNPVYTCEQSGKVVINITVDDQGRVIEASYNKASSNTTNGCLIDNAIYYARKARFNKDSKNKQLGTITYLFQ